MRWVSQETQWWRIHLSMQEIQETQVQSLSWEDPLEEEMATYCSVLAWRIPWTEEPGGLQSMGLQRVRHDWGTEHIYMQDAYTQRWIKYCSCLKEMEIVHEERGMEEISKNLPVIQHKKCYTNCLHSEGVLYSMVTEVMILCCIFKSCKEDQMVGWHRWFNGHELGQTLGGGEGQGGLPCCSPWGGKQSDTAWQLNKRLDLKSS